MPVPTIIPASTAASGISLLDLCRDLADQLGWRDTLVTDGAATGGERERYLLLPSARDDEETRNFLAGAYAYVLDGDQAGAQKRFLSQGYFGPQSAMGVASPYEAVIADGTSVEVTRPLPMTKYLERKGLVDIVGEALARCRVEARLQLTGDDTRIVDLSSVPWLTSKDQTNGLWDWGGTDQTLPASESRRSYDIIQRGAAISLEMDSAYGTDIPYELSVVVPANKLLKINGTWTYTPAGFTTLTDQAAAPLRWITTIGMVKALQHLRVLTKQGPTLPPTERAAIAADVAERLPTWARAAARIVDEEMADLTPVIINATTAGAQISGYLDCPPEVSSLPVGTLA